MDRRVTIQRATLTDDGFSTGPSAWVTVATVAASKSEISDAERSASQALGAVATTRFVIRYSLAVADVNPKDRLVCEGRTYDVSGVKEPGRREGLEITAARRADT